MHIKKILPFIITFGLLFAGTAFAYYSWPSSIQRGDIIIATSTTQTIRVATGTEGSLLMIYNGFPTYRATSTLGISGGTGLSSLNGQTGGTQTFTTSTLGGLQLNITSSSNIHTFTLQPASGYSIPLTASTTEWSTALLTKLSTTTAAATYEPILTKGNLTATSPLQFDNTRQVIGGAAAISVAAGYSIPLSASTTEWTNFYNTPSTRITAGTGLAWSGNTLNSLGGDVVGPASAVNNNVVFFDSTSGKLIKDSGLTLSGNNTGDQDLSSYVVGPNGGTAANNVVFFSDTTGKLVQDNGIQLTGSNSGDVTLSGQNYLSITGQAITVNQINLGSHVTGVLPISKGGTATSTAPSASAVLLGNGTNYDYSVLPSCSNTTTSKLLYNNSTRQFSCGTDQTGGGGGATTTITSNVQSDGPNFTFATSSATGLNLNISGSGSTITFAPQLQSGYVIPLSASTTEWSGFYNTPSTRITAGSGLSWSGNTLSNVMASSTIIAGGTATHSPSVTFATTTDTNILLSIVCGTSTCTFNPSWTGTLADGRIASATTWNNKLSAYNVISANGLISVSTTTALATLTASTSPTFTYVGATNASTTNLSVATNTYLTNVASCSNGLITGAGGLVSCNAAAFLTATAANALYPTFSYASSSYFTDFNVAAGSNIVITTSTMNTIAVSSTPSFTTLTVSGTTTLSAATTTINGLTYYWPSTVSGTKILQNDGSGNLSWVADQTGGGGSLSGGTTGFVGVWASSTAMTVGTLRDNGTVSGVNATSSSYTFNIQGSSNVNPFNISSSTGASLFSIDKKGQVTITGEGAAQLSIGSSTPYATLTVQGSSTQPTLDLLRIASSSNAVLLQVASNGSTTISSLGAGPVYSTAGGSLYIGAATGGGAGTISTSTTATIGKVAVWTGLATLGNGALIDNGTVIGMNATSSTIGFNIQGTAGTNTILNIASSTGTSILAVSPLARVGINTSSPVAIFQVQGTTGINNTLPLFDVASSSGVSLLRVLANGNVGIGSSSPSALFTIDSGTAVGTASTTIMIQQKFQIDTYNSAGTRVCLIIVGTTPTVITGACP